MSFGRKLKELRLAAGLSQKDLARVLDVSRNAVSQWESDETAPAANRLQTLARALGVRVHQLLEPSTDVRDKIVKSAALFFDRIGFEETTVEIICTAAEVDPDEFEQLFASKSDVLYEVLKAYNTRTFDDVKRIPPKYGQLGDRIKYLFRIYYAHDLAHVKLTAALHSFSWNWSRTRERENAAQLSEHHRTMISLFDEAATRGEIQPGNYMHASELLFAAYTYTLRKAVFEDFDADRLVEALSPQIDIVLSGMGYRALQNGPANTP